MSNEFVRLTLKLRSTQGGDPYFRKCMLDIVLDLDTRRAVNSDPMYGALGTHNDDPKEVYPFVLEPNGNIDFGSWDDDDRGGKINIYERDISIGEMVTITDEEKKKHTCEIVHMHIMGQSRRESKIRLGT